MLIDLKELADVIMEAESQDLQSASWRPRRTDGVSSSPRASIIQMVTYTAVFTAALFITVKAWKQPKLHQQRNGYRRCGTHMQWNITQPLKTVK